jgi:Arc/MetJ-type ribon-helix-helix transcriptional regulator
MENLKSDLNKKGIYPSKSEIIRAGLWNLKKMNTKQLEEALKELVKVKQTRIL